MFRILNSPYTRPHDVVVNVGVSRSRRLRPRRHQLQPAQLQAPQIFPSQPRQRHPTTPTVNKQHDIVKSSTEYTILHHSDLPSNHPSQSDHRETQESMSTYIINEPDLALDRHDGNIFVITMRKSPENRLDSAYCQKLIAAFNLVRTTLGPDSEGAVITKGNDAKFWCTVSCLFSFSSHLSSFVYCSGSARFRCARIPVVNTQGRKRRREGTGRREPPETNETNPIFKMINSPYGIMESTPIPFYPIPSHPIPQPKPPPKEKKEKPPI
jgi:hypothetical protein